MKKIIILSMVLLALIIVNINVDASTKLDGIESFPSTYQPYLKEIAKNHPNWQFKALYTNLDWDYVIDNENTYGTNLVPINYSDTWKNTTPGQYNVEIDSGWVDSSRRAVEFCMDPRNFLNEVRIFQFETLSYSEQNNTESVEKILYGTEFYNAQVSYLDSSGNTINMTEKYSDLILKGGQTSQVSPYHLASRIKQEVGPFLSHSSISGNVEGYEGLYNFYNIGATSSSEPMGAIKNGLQYAKDGKGASQSVKDKYLIPWNTKEKAITGGAIFIGSSYINVGQNTIYLQKFDVNDDRNGTLFTHQYMTNILAPYSESKSIYNGYQKSGILDTAMTFLIPVYNNMPDIPTSNPDINLDEFVSDNTKMYCNATNVNVRTGPLTSYEVITMLNKEDKVTRIEMGISSGERWDKVILESGIIGYVYQTYLTEVPAYISVTNVVLDQSEIYLEEGESFQINANVEPEDANNKEITFTTMDNTIAEIDQSGNVIAKSVGTTKVIATSNDNENAKAECIVNVVRHMEDSEIDFDSSLIINDFEISGIQYNENTVADIKGKITTDLEIEIVNNRGEVLQDTSIVGTGSIIKIKENGNVLRQYQIIIYGDANGDGKIDSVDLLVLQRHILQIELLEPIYMKATNINKNGNKPSSVDLLLIQRHILNLKKIEQV